MDLSTSACKLCRAPYCDIRLLGCGCTLHAVSSFDFAFPLLLKETQISCRDFSYPTVNANNDCDRVFPELLSEPRVSGVDN